VDVRLAADIMEFSDAGLIYRMCAHYAAAEGAGGPVVPPALGVRHRTAAPLMRQTLQSRRKMNQLFEAIEQDDNES